MLNSLEVVEWKRTAGRARYGAADTHIAHIMGSELANDPIPMTIYLPFSSSDEQRRRYHELGRQFGARELAEDDAVSPAVGPITLSVNEAEQYFIWDDYVDLVEYSPPRPSQPREYADLHPQSRDHTP